MGCFWQNPKIEHFWSHLCNRCFYQNHKREALHMYPTPKEGPFTSNPKIGEKGNLCIIRKEKICYKNNVSCYLLSLCMTCVTKTMWPRWNFNFGIIQACLHLTFNGRLVQNTMGTSGQKAKLKWLIGLFSSSSYLCIYLIS